MGRLRRSTLTRVRAALAVAGVLAATMGGGLIALSAFSADRDLSVGRVRLGVDPFHHGALDIYVPLVDWGVRFNRVRLPARLTVDLRSVDRQAAARVATGGELPAHALRREGRSAIASYLKVLILVVTAAALAAGLLTALALRSAHVAPVRRLLAVAGGAALACGAAVALLLPPRGDLDHPEYYAQGPDIPVALRALQTVGRTPARLSEELDTQLLGLARLVEAPGERRPLTGLPRIVVASDLHNNILALPALERAARGAPVFFPGDLTDRGSPLEAGAVRRVVRLGHPFVFVAGNHDSDVVERQLARRGAVVLRSDGRLLPGAPGHTRRGPVINRIGGLRVAGYQSPNERTRADGFRDKGSGVTPAEQQAFTAWLLGLAGKVDVVLAHEPELVAPAIRILRADRTLPPLLLLVGHTHHAGVDAREDVVEVNGGSLGAGGTGNLAEGQDLGLAVVTYERSPLFRPLAADTVTIDPGTGSARASRVRLDAATRPAG